MTVSDSRLDYQSLPPEPLRPSQAGVGIASAIVAVFFALLAIAFRLDVLEALVLQFYFYSIGFITAFALGIWGLFVRNRRRSAAWIGLCVSMLGFGWKVSSLYVLMRSCVANGWRMRTGSGVNSSTTGGAVRVSRVLEKGAAASPRPPEAHRIRARRAYSRGESSSKSERAEFPEFL